MKHLHIFFYMTLGIAAFAQTPQLDNGGNPNIQIKDFGSIGENGRRTISPDGLHFATVVMQGSRYVAMLDGKTAGEKYDEISKLMYGPDSSHFAYFGRKGDNYVVVLDGQESSPYLSVSGMVFSSDGKHFAYVAQKSKNECCVVLDGKEGTPFESINKIIFSPDGQRFAYEARIFDREATGGKRDVVVIDGRKIFEGQVVHISGGGEFTTEGFGVCFSSDSKHVAFKKEEPGKESVFLDGNEGTTYDYNSIGPLSFGPDGLHLTYTVEKRISQYEHHTIKVVDGQEIPNSPDTLVSSPGGNRIAYIHSTQHGQTIIVDNKEGSEYDKINHVFFSPDASHVAYAAIKHNKIFLVIDGEESDATIGGGTSTENDIDSCVFFSPDSKHYAYVAMDSEVNHQTPMERTYGNYSFVVVDGKAGQRYNKISSLVFSPDSKHLIYGAAKGSESGNQSVLVFDAEEIALPKGRWPRDLIFSPDSQHWACSCSVDRDHDSIIVDGQVLPTLHDPSSGYHADTIFNLQFSPDSKHIAYVHDDVMKLNVIVDNQMGPTFTLIRGLKTLDFASELRQPSEKTKMFNFSQNETVAYIGFKDNNEAFFVQQSSKSDNFLANIRSLSSSDNGNVAENPQKPLTNSVATSNTTSPATAPNNDIISQKINDAGKKAGAVAGSLFHMFKNKKQ